MKRWTRPQGIVEQFEANEYVAACWYVACSVGAANEVEETMPPTNPNNGGSNNYDNGQTHASGQCGTSGNQVIVTNSSGIATGMYEINSTTGVRQLTCTLYSDGKYTTGSSYSDVAVGDYIYWTTKLSNGTTWYHQGNVNGVDPKHPNRS